MLSLGFTTFLVGASISVIDLLYPHKFSTILEMDYGTPFDRHTIIEDSHETKKKKKTTAKLEEPATVGFGGLLRRLSKRDRDRGMDHHPGVRQLKWYNQHISYWPINNIGSWTRQLCFRDGGSQVPLEPDVPHRLP